MYVSDHSGCCCYTGRYCWPFAGFCPFRRSYNIHRKGMVLFKTKTWNIYTCPTVLIYIHTTCKTNLIYCKFNIYCFFFQNCSNPVSLILVDRTLDLAGVTSHSSESVLDKIMATLPRFPGHSNDVAVDMSPICEANV